MPLLSNIRRLTADATGTPFDDWVVPGYVDTLYDYMDFLQRTGPYIATMPAGPQPKVAIIGAGAAGMVAAYELLKLGVTPVIFEASQRVGGRAYSKEFRDMNGNDLGGIAELGSMRVPTANRLFFYYYTLFNPNFQPGPFPDPGTVYTKLSYQNQVYDWQPGPPPSDFTRVAQLWNNFVTPILNAVWTPWQAGNLPGVIQAWQQYINQYKDMTFFDALAATGQWTEDDLNRFGALGVGSGGFGPLYSVGILEIIRLIVNQLESNQQFIPLGMSALPLGFYNATVNTRFGPATLKDKVQFGCQVTGLDINTQDNQPVVLYTDANGNPQAAEFAAVIVATTTRAMEMMGLTLPSPLTGNFVLSSPVRDSLRQVHLMSSSKLFILTQTKFWQGNASIPQTIQTDELPRGVYALDYPDTPHGVVLISYTWGDDSTKLMALGAGQDVYDRFKVLKNAIAQISPEFAQYLVPVDDVIYNIDWQTQPNYYGAFKLQYPGQEADVAAAYYQFLTATNPSQDTGVYLAGDSVSWSGGWTEGALQTGLNAACAVALRLGGTFVDNSPLDQNPNMYQY